MRCAVIILMFFVGNTSASRADDLEDVKAARHHHFADLNAGDIEAWVDHHLAGHGEFRAGGGLLIEPPSPIESGRIKFPTSSWREIVLSCKHPQPSEEGPNDLPGWSGKGWGTESRTSAGPECGRRLRAPNPEGTRPRPSQNPAES